MFGEPVTIRMEGMSAIQMHLQQLPEKVRRKHLRKALNDAMELVREEAVRHIPPRKISHGWEAFVTYPGAHLKDSVIKEVSIRAAGAFGKVGLDYKKVHHGHLVEFGTRKHWIKIKTRRGKTMRLQHPGARKHPFMRVAFANKSDEAVDLLVHRLMAAVEMEMDNGS